MTAAQWAAIAPMIPTWRPAVGHARPTNARAWMRSSTSCARAALGGSCRTISRPGGRTVYYYLRRWQREGVWERVHHMLVIADRERNGRDASPSAAVIDSQTVRTADQKGDLRATTPESGSTGASGTS